VISQRGQRWRRREEGGGRRKGSNLKVGIESCGDILRKVRDEPPHFKLSRIPWEILALEFQFILLLPSPFLKPRAMSEGEAFRAKGRGDGDSPDGS
jgi:hypothetical protein